MNFVQSSAYLLAYEEWPGLAPLWNGLFRAKGAQRLRVLLNNLSNLHSPSAATNHVRSEKASPVKAPESKLDCMIGLAIFLGARSTLPRLKNFDR